MYMWYYGLHIITGVSWIVFLLQFIKTFQYNKTADKVIFNFLSLFFMFVVLFLGVKLILMNPSVAKSGGWLHTKLSLIIILMLENLYLSVKFFKKKTISKILSEFLYWFTYIVFAVILYLAIFKSF